MGIAKGRTQGSTSMKKKVYESLDLKDERFKKLTKKLVDVAFDKTKYRVYTEDDSKGDRTIFKAVLNKTSKNENNLCTIQLLEDNEENYYFGHRWGREDARGRTSFIKFEKKLAAAKKHFFSKLNELTKNESLKDVKDNPGKYYVIDIDMDSLMVPEENKTVSVPESKLPEEIQDLMKTICNIGPFTKVMKKNKLNRELLSLGMLSEEQILKGYQVLKKIGNKLSQNNSDSFVTLTSAFYSYIPHYFSTSRPIIIDNQKKLKVETDLLKVLYDYNCVDRMLKKDVTGVFNPIQRNYEQIGCKIKVVDDESDVYEILQNYLELNHSHIHSDYRMELEEIYEIDRNEEFVSKGNLQLLWHGSKLSNIASILGNGLTLPPEEVSNFGSMFDSGIYFADVSSKSANYSMDEDDIGFLILAQVSLGKVYETYGPDNNASSTVEKNKCDSLRAIGKLSPNKSSHSKIIFGKTEVTVPIGKCEEITQADDCILRHNEYVVYDESQVCIRFLMKVKYINNTVTTSEE